jgi:hypothetical protein
MIDFTVEGTRHVMYPEYGLPPCTEFVYSPKQILIGSGSLADVEWDVKGLYFIDRNGVPWVRSATSISTGVHPPKPSSRAFEVVKSPQMKKADLCGR